MLELNFVELETNLFNQKQRLLKWVIDELELQPKEVRETIKKVQILKSGVGGN